MNYLTMPFLKRINVPTVAMVFLFCLWFSFSWQLTAAEEGSVVEIPAVQACNPVDVIFIVDQSSSMSIGGNDPTEQRKHAVEAAIDQLADIALDLCPGIIHRVAVISFGTTAVIDLTLSDIGPFDPNKPNEAYNRRDVLKRSVRVADMGQTHAIAAFALAREILDDHGPATSRETDRRRAIIFLTDGVPCVNPGGVCGPDFNYGAYAVEMRRQIDLDFSFDPALLERERCINNLRDQRPNPFDPLPAEQLNSCLIEHPVGPDAFWNSAYVWLILMRDADRPYPQSLLNIFSSMAQSRAGRVINVSNNRQEIPTTFRNILEQLTGVRAARLQCGNFAVNPYLEKARLVFYKADPATKVRLSFRDVSGKEFVMEDGQGTNGGFELHPQEGHSVFGANERYLLLNPYPGVWNLSSDDCNNLDAFYEPISIAASSPRVANIIPQYDRLPYYNEGTPFYLEFQLRDEKTGQIVPQAEHPRFAVQVNAILNGPDPQQFNFTWLPQEQLFRSPEPIRAQHVGKYEVVFEVTSYRREGEPTNVGLNYDLVFANQYVLFKDSLDIEIIPVTPFLPQILEPAAEAVLLPIHIQPDAARPPAIVPLLIRITITDRQEEAVFAQRVSEIFEDPDNSFVARVADPNNDVHVLTLQHDRARPGEFFGQIDGLYRAGSYQLSVELTGGFYERRYYPDILEVSSEFSRRDEIWRFELLDPVGGATISPIHTSPAVSGFRWPPWRLEIEPLLIRARLVDEAGQPYNDPDAVMEYAPSVIAATVTAAEINRSAQLMPDANRPGEYIGQVDGMATHGEHSLVVALELSYPNYTPESIPTRISFNRTDTLLTSPRTYVGLTLLAFLILVFLLWRYFAVRSNKLAGELVFLDQGKEIGRISLFSGKNWRVIKKQELDEYPQFGLKKIVAYSTPKPKAGKDEDGLPALGFMGNGREVRLDYITNEGDRVRGELLGSNGHITFGLFQIKYEDSTGE
jgi:hypothetical protein